MKNNYDTTRIRFSDEIQRRYNLTGKRVLDLGCGNDGFMLKYIAQQYHPQQIIGIDRGLKIEEGPGYVMRSGDARALEFESNSFDIVYSVSTFEHINGIKETLDEIRRVLKPFGKAHINFAPVWTSICGHHSYNMANAFTDECIKEGGNTDENIVYAIPAWGHLYMGEDEMRDHLMKVHFQENKIEVLLYDIYHNDFINRVPVADMKNYLMHSGLIIREYHELVTFSRAWALEGTGPSELTPEIKERILQSGYRLSDIGVVYIKTILEKYESI